MNTRSIRGFTLVELLVVIAIIGVIFTLLAPALAKSKIAAQRVQCASNMRVIGQAILAYAVANQGRAPQIKGPGESGFEYPYEWSKANMVNPLARYGMTLGVMTCPSQMLFNPPYDQWTGHSDGSKYWLVNYLYILGYADPDVKPRLGGGKWYEDPPSVGSYRLSKGSVKIMLVDMNLYFAAGDNGFNIYGPVPNVKWFYSNHAVRNKFDPHRVELRSFVKGSNRLYTDGHVKWVGADQMGRGELPITTQIDSARYSHNGDNRPYFW